MWELSDEDSMDYAYAYGYQWNITEQECLDFCELKRQTGNWTRYAACEYFEPQLWHGSDYASSCRIYGNSDLCASGGNSSYPGVCYTYDTDGCPGTKLNFRVFCFIY